MAAPQVRNLELCKKELEWERAKLTKSTDDDDALNSEGDCCPDYVAACSAGENVLRLQKLQDASEAYFQRHSASAAPSEAVAFAAELGRITDANNRKLDAGMSKVDAVRSQVEEVKETMVDNIDKVLARGERLDDVLLKSDQMKDSAETFRLQGKKLRRAMCCQNLRMKLLVFGLLVGPPATAMLLVKRVPMIMVVAIASGAIAVTLGLAISFHYDTAGGATMAGLSVLQFFIVFIAQEVRASLRNRKLTPAAA